MAEFSEQELIRRESLAKLRELGIEPYPAAEYPVNATAAQILEEYDPEDFTELNARMDEYMTEFEKNGLNAISVDIDN